MESVSKLPAHLNEVDSKPFLLKLFIYTVLCTTSFLYISYDHFDMLPATYNYRAFYVIVSMFTLGIMWGHAQELMHQTLHGTAIRASPFWNRVAGQYLGLPNLLSFSDYQFDHLSHHKTVGTPVDPEWFIHDFQGSLFDLFIYHFFKIADLRHLVDSIVKSFQRVSVQPRAPSSINRRIHNEFYFLFTFMVSMALLAAWDFMFCLKMYLIPYIISLPAHVFMEIPEHFQTAPTKDLYKNSRTIVGSKFSEWLTNYNNFHVEHHIYAAVPMDKLYIVHDMIKNDIAYKHDTYPEFYKNVLLGFLWSKLKI